MVADAHRQIEAWIDAFGDDILRLAYTYTRDHHLAEDIFQEVFWRAYRSLDSFRGEASPRTWLCRIAANACRDRLRSSTARYVTPIGDAIAFLRHAASRDGDPEAAALARAARDDLWQHVLSLPLPFREAIVLYYYADLSTDEIARLTRAPTGTVRSRLERGRKLLRRRLEGD